MKINIKALCYLVDSSVCTQKGQIVSHLWLDTLIYSANLRFTFEDGNGF